MAWALIAVYLLLASPIQAEAAVRLQFGKKGKAEARLGLLVWGIRLSARLELYRDETNRPFARLVSGKKETAILLKSKGAGAWKKPGAQYALKRLLSLFSFSADIQIGGADAARTALLSGLLAAAGAAVPRVRLRCRPRYNGESGVFLLCIAQARLGTIIAVCLRGLMKNRRAGRKKEGKKTAWIVPSGT